MLNGFDVFFCCLGSRVNQGKVKKYKDTIILTNELIN